MLDKNFEILKYTDAHREQILEVWEKSVLATHTFLKPSDFNAIKELVLSIDFNALEVYCLVSDGVVAGFIGVADLKVEMLFLSPNQIGKGFGQKLMNFAINELKADKVDVNEQNTKAVRFYEKIGFHTYERTEKDDQGKDYPILRMELQKV